jgi:hypothetical protein
MAKLTPNIPYEDLGDSHQLAEFSAALVMESSESVSYLALVNSNTKPKAKACTASTSIAQVQLSKHRE